SSNSLRKRCPRSDSSPALATIRRTSAICSIASRTCLGKWPALDVFGGDELALAAADEFFPTAAETRGETLRLFFANPIARDAAAGSLSDRYSVAPPAGDDEDWAPPAQEHPSPIQT